MDNIFFIFRHPRNFHMKIKVLAALAESIIFYFAFTFIIEISI